MSGDLELAVDQEGAARDHTFARREPAAHRIEVARSCAEPDFALLVLAVALRDIHEFAQAAVEHCGDRYGDRTVGRCRWLHWLQRHFAHGTLPGLLVGLVPL